MDALTIGQEAHHAWLEVAPSASLRVELDLLDVPCPRPPAALCRAQLIERVRGSVWFGDERPVHIDLVHVRRTLEDDLAVRRCVRAVGGVGYRMALG